MADEDMDLLGDDENPQSGDEQRTPDEWARYRREQNARKKAERERNDAKKEAAFLRAGIDPSDERMSYFVKGYEGEADPEKIKEAATRAGFLAPTTVEPDPAAQAAAEGLARVDALAEGAAPDGGVGAESRLDAAFAEGGDKAVEDQMRQMGIPVRYSS